MTILLLILLFVISISSIWTSKAGIDAVSSNDSSSYNKSTTSPDKYNSFNFKYSKTGSALGLENRISYNSTSNILSANTDEKPINTIKISEANESKLQEIFTKNEFLNTSTNPPLISDSIFYSLGVEMNGTLHRIAWSHSSDQFVSQRMLKITNEVVDFVCKSSTNPIACEAVMLDFR